MKKALFVFLFPVLIFSRANVTVVPGADPIKFYLGNYPYADMVGPTNMPALTLRLASDLNALCYKNSTGDLFKIYSSDVDSSFIPYANSSSRFGNSLLKKIDYNRFGFINYVDGGGAQPPHLVFYDSSYNEGGTGNDGSMISFIQKKSIFDSCNGYYDEPVAQFQLRLLNDGVAKRSHTQFVFKTYGCGMGYKTHWSVMDSSGQLVLNDSTYLDARPWLPVWIKHGGLKIADSLIVGSLSSNNKLTYINSSGKLDTTGVTHYGDATIFPGAIWGDSSYSGIAISNLGSGARQTLIAAGGSWTSDYGAYINLTGNGDQDSTGSALIKAGSHGNINLSGDSLIFHLEDTSDGLSNVRKDLIVRRETGLGYDDTNTVFIEAARSDKSVLRIQGGKGSSTGQGMIQLGNEESNRVDIFADTVSIDGLVVDNIKIGENFGGDIINKIFKANDTLFIISASDTFFLETKK
jgi:hypothetical protein